MFELGKWIQRVPQRARAPPSRLRVAESWSRQQRAPANCDGEEDRGPSGATTTQGRPVSLESLYHRSCRTSLGSMWFRAPAIGLVSHRQEESVRELSGWSRAVGHARASLALLSLCCLSAALHAGGNVSVRVDRGGNLVIEGDDADNEILIRPFAIGAGDVFGMGATLVNGGESASFSGVDDDFQIRMQGGDDRVLVDDGDGNTVPDDLEIDTGHGDDFVLVEGFFVLDDLTILTGPGADTIELSQTVVVSDRTDIHTGSGDDQLLLLPANVPDLLLVFEDEFQVRTGSGRDYVSIAGALFRRRVDIDLGAGDDLGEQAGLVGGLCVCGTRFEAADVLKDVRFG